MFGLKNTKIAVFQLIERGKLALDTVVETILPELKNPVVLDVNTTPQSTALKQSKSEITIRHLLTHTSGLFYNVNDGRPKPFHISLAYTTPHNPHNPVQHFYDRMKVFIT
jgi:CubicO group peptidase (beta-lactamase class C family)